MIEIKGLSKQYGEKVIFRDLSLTLKDGEVLAILGPSGIGKTTLIKTLTGLEAAQSGEIEMDGQSYSISDPAVTSKIGLIFQDFNLFPHLTVRDNIILAPMSVKKMSKDEANQKANDLLAKLGLTEQADLYPYQLSGGQKQRVGIARALAMDPQVIAYDEPTSGLDEKATEQVVAIMLSLKAEGVSQIVVTHDLPFAEKVADETFDFEKEVHR
ncbi:amino acid ABC transporter ATP-binding protein [Fructobacillus fructosus]|uniref:ATPase component (GlnQ) n=1 Tax=Fructobacillus fructosus TaxID=1631 RepID=A0ABN9YH83_9LACO|nr:amino acid ABC transporter ATP-binding protein [Fructobacillus fructosus]MBD9364320.1 amino acid ABC transporter ATP-binding protein [Leuconostoc mesenteroides]MBC9118100.1 amino acid ABC transporter ATP-binding protein [Fructobacillus fructosus]MCK8638263.1 amino acid ABC transporter ATP-binding protein [Fructobacillus fructosus]CAK1222765.1 ABC-type polar amino acid transport system [Fructobacillus fructosus]CAK1227892.1 ABC-type polar amino acid transport system [Fructobacillus fructosus